MRLAIALLLLFNIGHADVFSTNGEINFDVQKDQVTEMTLNANGLGIGTDPSANLHVTGNVVLDDFKTPQDLSANIAYLRVNTDTGEIYSANIFNSHPLMRVITWKLTASTNTETTKANFDYEELYQLIGIENYIYFYLPQDPNEEYRLSFDSSEDLTFRDTTIERLSDSSRGIFETVTNFTYTIYQSRPIHHVHATQFRVEKDLFIGSSGNAGDLQMADETGNPLFRIVADTVAAHAAAIVNNWGNSDTPGVLLGTTQSSGNAFQVSSSIPLNNGLPSGIGTQRFVVKANGNVGIGTSLPEGALDISSTSSGLVVPRMTTAERDAISAVNGMILYNTTTNAFNFYENGSWVTK